MVHRTKKEVGGSVTIEKKRKLSLVPHSAFQIPRFLPCSLPSNF